MIDEMQVIVGAAYKHLYRLDKRIKLQESNLEYQKESEKKYGDRGGWKEAVIETTTKLNALKLEREELKEALFLYTPNY